MALPTPASPPTPRPPRLPQSASNQPGRWLRVLTRADLAQCLGECVEETILGGLRLPGHALRRLRREVLRRFFARTALRARRVRGLSRREFLRELESTQLELVRQRDRARMELESLRGRLALSRARLDSSALDEGTERTLSEELAGDLTALLARAPTERRAAIEDVVRRERERRRAALDRALRIHRSRIDVLERRVAKLRASLAQTEEDLAELALRARLDPGIPSIYRAVQGLSETSLQRAAKAECLRAIFEANVELRRRAA